MGQIEQEARMIEIRSALGPVHEGDSSRQQRNDSIQVSDDENEGDSDIGEMQFDSLNE